MNEDTQKRGPFFMITGLVIGFLLGLMYAAWISPVKLVNTEPKILSVEAKDDYRRMIALSYASNKDLGRASARLSLLGDEIQTTALLDATNRLRKSNGSMAAIQAMENLMRDLQTGPKKPESQPSPTVTVTNPPADDGDVQDSDTTGQLEDSTTVAVAQAVQTATPDPTSIPTPEVDPTFPPQTTLTAFPVLDVTFVLLKQREVCDPSLPGGLIQVMVEDTAGDPLAGVEIKIAWGEGREESFFSGLYPQISLGYGDFLMDQQQRYWLEVGKGGDMVSDLEIPVCTNEDGSEYAGGWLLYFAARERTTG